jgi:hypothetical protein
MLLIKSPQNLNNLYYLPITTTIKIVKTLYYLPGYEI